MWRLVISCLVCFIPSGLRGTETPEVEISTGRPRIMNALNLWIDGKEIEQFVGVPMDIFVIREGAVVPYLQDGYFDSQLPVLPPEVHVVRLTWMAKDGIYTYQFSDLRSLDPHTLYDPLLSIPRNGVITKTLSDFQMAIPCTGRVTAIASMYINLVIKNNKGLSIPGSPIKLHLRKRCIAFDSRALCRHECQNGGKCNSLGQCDCRPGFYGSQCHLAVCFPACENNGTCISPGQCQCMAGYLGDSCETAICKKSCHNGGVCLAPEQCDCPAGFYGQYCQYHTGLCPIPCKNGGTCTSNNVCQCPKGYMGEFCQKPICQRTCGVHGRCVDVDDCQCYRGWRGRYCHKTLNRLPDSINAKRKWRRRHKRPDHGRGNGREGNNRNVQKRDNKQRRKRGRRKC